MGALLRIALPIAGIALILFQLVHLGDRHAGLDSPIWGLLLGAGLIIAPFTALGMLAMYLALVGIPLGLALFGAYLWAHIFEAGASALVGFLAGGWIGYKFVTGDIFDKMFEPVRRLGDKGKP